MGTTYEYTYDYDVKDSKGGGGGNNNNTRNPGNRTQRTAGHQSNHSSHAPLHRPGMDPLVNLQHDRIWNKLYDPQNMDKSGHEAEAQKMARRQDRKVIKIEAAYGSDRQTIIIKRNYDLRVRDVQEDASKVFKMPLDQIILYWKGRNICDTPNDLLESLGIENNHQMRVCREDDPAQQSRRRELRSYANAEQQYSSNNDMQKQQQQPYSNYPGMYDQQQQQFGTSPRGNYYQTPNNQASVASTFVLNLQIGFGDRLEGLVIGRPHPITIYDLQMELQQRFNIPVMEQNVSYNGMPLLQFPPDATVDTLGIVNNSFISLWYKNSGQNNQQQPPPPPQDYYQPKQQPPASSYPDESQSPRGGGMDPSQRRMDYSNNSNNNDSTPNGNNQDVLKIEVFHGSDRHVLILRSTNNLRIADLMEELQRITTVPVSNQKLYFRGQELQNGRDRTLRDAGIDNNAQVRLIGDPMKTRYEAMITGNRN